jgi:hypothetical protein
LVKKAIRQELNVQEAHEALSLWFEAINDGDIVLLPDADYLAAASALALQLAHPLAVACIWRWPSAWAAR